MGRGKALSYKIGEVVYLRTDPDNYPRLISRMMISDMDQIQLELSCGTVTSWHFLFEVTKEITKRIKINGFNGCNKQTRKIKGKPKPTVE